MSEKERETGRVSQSVSERKSEQVNVYVCERERQRERLTRD